MNEKALREALVVVLRVLRLQQVRIRDVENSLFALRETVSAHVPMQSYDGILRQTVLDRHGSARTQDDVLLQIDAMLKEIGSLDPGS